VGTQSIMVADATSPSIAATLAGIRVRRRRQ
jgi:hypothetical protein